MGQHMTKFILIFYFYVSNNNIYIHFILSIIDNKYFIFYKIALLWINMSILLFVTFFKKNKSKK